MGKRESMFGATEALGARLSRAYIVMQSYSIHHSFLAGKLSKCGHPLKLFLRVEKLDKSALHFKITCSLNMSWGLLERNTQERQRPPTILQQLLYEELSLKSTTAYLSNHFQATTVLLLSASQPFWYNRWHKLLYELWMHRK